MIQRISSSYKKIWQILKQPPLPDTQVLLVSSGVAGLIIVLRLTGLLQYWEWAVLDVFFQSRPSQPVDERILIVGIDEVTLQQLGRWPISDGLMAKGLQHLHSLGPRAIGLDIYRDLPVEPGHSQLVKTAQSIPNLIGIEQLQDKNSPGVSPPPILSKLGRVGFNNVVVDADDNVRRSLLYWHIDGKPHTSFALQLALKYLASEGITPQPSHKSRGYLQLGKAVFRRFRANDGAYVRADAKGYQILANFKGPAGSFRRVSMTEVLANQVPEDWVRDRIILIGSTATSLKDFFSTPYSNGFSKSPQRVSGVEVQANFVSQILDAAQGKPALINVWSDSIECLWIWVWCCLGGVLIWGAPSLITSVCRIFVVAVGLIAGCYWAFLAFWWLPLASPLLGLVSSAIAMIIYIAQREKELKRSKEFLHNLLNAIPDPIFVKNQQHQWIVLNEAYCQFIGYPPEVLINKSEPEFFPAHEAETFWQQDNLVLQTCQAQEHEEQFTDAKGITHLIATKRSLHKDAAGNVFLVGVIRDITERKQLEERLKRQAAQLVRSNAELKRSEGRLRYLAYHDPLTGLGNRKLFYERLSQSLKEAKINRQTIALLFLDLDGFKQINDTLGHDMGDLLLKTVAKRLTRTLRESDFVSRLGGDEFTAILPHIYNFSDAGKIAEKLLSNITQPFMLSGKTVIITTSIGISLFPIDGEDADTLIKKADAAMYRAKQLGKNKYEFA
jgi:diguanylate cyclase (GGDEF)-like protein/PAS domain S-box-containing protein